jgi:hypothetical protein
MIEEGEVAAVHLEGGRECPRALREGAHPVRGEHGVMPALDEEHGDEEVSRVRAGKLAGEEERVRRALKAAPTA